MPQIVLAPKDIERLTAVVEKISSVRFINEALKSDGRCFMELAQKIRNILTNRDPDCKEILPTYTKLSHHVTTIAALATEEPSNYHMQYNKLICDFLDEKQLKNNEIVRLTSHVLFTLNMQLFTLMRES